MSVFSTQTRLPEAVHSHQQAPVPPWRRLSSGHHGLWRRLSRLALWHGHGHHLHLLCQLDHWLLHLLLALLPLLSFFLMHCKSKQRKVTEGSSIDDVYDKYIHKFMHRGGFYKQWSIAAVRREWTLSIVPARGLSLISDRNRKCWVLRDSNVLCKRMMHM